MTWEMFYICHAWVSSYSMLAKPDTHCIYLEIHYVKICPFTLLHVATMWNACFTHFICVQDRPLGSGEREAHGADWQCTHRRQVQLHQQLCWRVEIHSIFPCHRHCLRRVQVHNNMDIVSLTDHHWHAVCLWWWHLGFLTAIYLPCINNHYQMYMYMYHDAQSR